MQSQAVGSKDQGHTRFHKCDKLVRNVLLVLGRGFCFTVFC